MSFFGLFKSPSGEGFAGSGESQSDDAARIRELELEVDKARRQSKDLVANVSHELRTPLAAIMAIAENLTDGVTPWSQATGEELLKYTDRLNDLVGYMLDLSKVDSGALSLQIEEVSAGDFVEGCIEAVQFLDAAKDIRFVLNVFPEELTLQIDRKRLGQALQNLLTNAIKFSPTSGTIRVDALHDSVANCDTITVVDEGPGISESQREKVFERFSTSAVTSSSDSQATKHKTGGTGLGLSIAKWAVELHGGRIAAIESDSGVGAAFRMWVPVDAI